MKHLSSVEPSIWLVANTSWYVFNFRSRLISVLQARGYSISVLSPTDEYTERLAKAGIRHFHLPVDSGGTNPLKDGQLVAWLLRLFRRERPNLLLTYTPKVNIYCSVAAAVLGIPVVANISGLGRAFVNDGWLTSLVKLLYRAALRHPHRVFFQNEDDRQIFLDNRLVAGKRTERLPGSGVDVERFSPRRRISARIRPFVFLLVARLLWDKGVGDYVEAARIVKRQTPDTEFRLLGFLDVQNPSAIPASQIAQWQAEGIVHYVGVSDDVVAHYAEADCVVLPSFYREGVPRTLLEAASMAIPIIASDAVGCRDTVDDGINGFLCEPRSPADLANKMLRMVRMGPVERAKMGAAGRRKIQASFDERVVIERYLHAIDSALSSRKVS